MTIPFGSPGGLPARVAAVTSLATLGRDAGQRVLQPWPLHDTLEPAGVGRLTGSWSRLME